MRIWYWQLNHTEAPRGGFQTVFKLSYLRDRHINRLPVPDRPYLVIESDLDGYVIKEEYATTRYALYGVLGGKCGKM